MPRIIKLSNGQTARFPDEMDDSAILSVLRKQFPPQQSAEVGLPGITPPQVDMQPVDKLETVARGAEDTLAGAVGTVFGPGTVLGNMILPVMDKIFPDPADNGQQGKLTQAVRRSEQEVALGARQAQKSGNPIAETLAPFSSAPLVNVASLGISKQLPAGIPQGIGEGVEDFASSLTQPVNAAIGAAGVAAKAGSVAQRLMSHGFQLDMINHAMQNMPGVKDAVEAGDYRTAARLLTEAAGSTVMAGLAGTHAIAREKAPSMAAGIKPQTPTERGTDLLTRLPSQQLAAVEGVLKQQATPQGSQPVTKPNLEAVRKEISGRQRNGAQIETPLSSQEIRRAGRERVTIPNEGPSMEQQRIEAARGSIAERLGLDLAKASPEDLAAVDQLAKEGYTGQSSQSPDPLQATPSKSKSGEGVPAASRPDIRSTRTGEEQSTELPEERTPVAEQAKPGEAAAPTGSNPSPKPTAREPKTLPVYGRNTEVLIPGEKTKYQATYSLREAEDVVASHNGQNFEPREDYHFKNDRNYSEPQNAERIIKQTAEFDPSFMVNDNPTAEQGPPIIDWNGNVLGGNSRTMTLERVRRSSPEAYKAYREKIRTEAKRLGLDPAAVDKMKEPVLVRQIVDEVSDPQAAITNLNKVGTAELRQAERAIADSRRVTPKTIEEITKRIEDQGPEGTLAQALDGDAVDLVNRLTEDGVLTLAERPRLMNSDGRLTAEGKQRMTRLLTGRLFEDARHFEETAPELRQKVERIVAPLAKVEGVEGWDITDKVKEGVRLVEEARTRDLSIDELTGQRGMFGDKNYSAEAIAIAKKLQSKPTEVAKAFRQYAAEAELGASDQMMMGMEPPTQAESFRAAFRTVDQLKEDIKGQLGTERGSISGKRAKGPSLSENLTELAGIYIREGVQKFSEFLKRVRETFGKVPNGVAAAWNKAKKLNQDLGRGNPERGSVTVDGRSKPLHEMDIEDLRAAEMRAETQDKQSLVTLFGREGAKRYAELERRANSSSATEAQTTAAYEEMGRMERESGKSKAEVDRILYGIGDPQRLNVDEVRDIRRELEALNFDSPQALGASLAKAITDIGDKTDPATMKPSERIAYAKLRHGFEQAMERGWSPEEVSKAAIQNASRRFSDPADAELMLQRFIKPPVRRRSEQGLLGNQRGSVRIEKGQPEEEAKIRSTASGSGGRGGRTTETAAAAGAEAEPGGRSGQPVSGSNKLGGERNPTVSPSYDLTKSKILKNVAPEVASAMEERLQDFESRNTKRTVVTFEDIREEARSLDPTIVARLDASKMKAGETLDPAVRFAARETLNGLNQEITSRRQEMSKNAGTWDENKRLEEMRKVEAMEEDAKRLIDVLIPTRSQDGRNLAYHAMVAKSSFDVTYWLSRARRARALPEGVELPPEVEKGIREATGKGAAAEAAAVDRIQGDPAKGEAATRRKAEREAKAELGPEPAGGPESKSRAERAKAAASLTREQIVAQARKDLAKRLDASIKGLQTEKVEPISDAERQAWERDPEIIDRRAKLAAIRKELRERRDGPITRDMEVERKRQEFINRLKARAKGEKLEVNPVKPEERELWEKDPEVLKLRAEIAKKFPPPLPPSLAEKQARYREKLLAKIEEKMKGVEKKPKAKSKWELTAAERAEVDNDPAVKQARINLARKMMRLDRSTWLETLTTLRRAGLLTSVRTHLRNFGGNSAFQAMEETSRLPAMAVDAALSTFTGERTVEGPSIRSMSRASRAAATRGVKEAAEIMRKGATDDQLAQMDMVKELNSGNRYLDAYANTIFRSMSAADRIFKTYAYERSMQEQLKLTGRTEPTEGMRLKAWEDANFATFNNDNMASDLLKRGKTALAKYGEAGQLANFAIDLAVPFARTPANIVARVIDYTPVGSSARAAMAVRKAMRGGEGLTPEFQQQISMAIGRGAVGSALLTLGWNLSQAGLMTGIAPESRGERDVDEAAGRLYGSFLIDGKWHKVDAFSPLGNMLTLGATLQREQEKGAGSILFAGAKTVMEQPMLSGASQVVDVIKDPARSANRFAGSVAGSFVPSAVADVASALDDKRRDPKGDSLGASVAGAVSNRLPGLRNTLPERKDVLGREQRQEWLSIVDPTIGSEAKELSKPVLKEMVENRVVMQKPNRPKDMPVEVYQQRQKLIGDVIEARLGELIANSAYAGDTTLSRRRLEAKAKVKPEDGVRAVRREMIEAEISKVRSTWSRAEKAGSFEGLSDEEKKERVLRRVKLSSKQ